MENSNGAQITRLTIEKKGNSNGARDKSVTIDQERILMVREMLAYKSINGKF